ncbi:hypothetical protein V8C35DRAFT_313045 [Trichoderma chlorosporum]
MKNVRDISIFISFICISKSDVLTVSLPSAHSITGLYIARLLFICCTIGIPIFVSTSSRLQSSPEWLLLRPSSPRPLRPSPCRRILPQCLHLRHPIV